MTQQPMGQQYYEQQPMQPMGTPGFAPPIQAEDGKQQFFKAKNFWPYLSRYWYFPSFAVF
jgi:hypothetical protein